MKELLAIRSDGYLDKGGSTRPWKIITINPEENEPLLVPYVLKLFTKNNIKQQNSIGKEFLGNFLTSEFDLRAPECGLVELSQIFLSTLEKDQALECKKKYQGKTFASKLMEGAVLVNKIPIRRFEINHYANVYAFDCLILNTDRGGIQGKPNLLTDDEGFILIDHELSFAFADSENDDALQIIINSLKNSSLNTNFYCSHIFYNILKNYKGGKRNIFDEFCELLRSINIKNIEDFINILKDNGISFGDTNRIIEYISFNKHNSDKFVNSLLRSIA